MEKTRTTLDQWITLQAVVDCGGFAQAAEVLHRTQSAISYTISKLEQTLEIEIFSLEKRRAVLTPKGEMLLALSRELTNKAILLETKAKLLNSKCNIKIKLVIDTLYHTDNLLDKVANFIKRHKDYDIDIIKQNISKSDVFALKDYDILITDQHVETLNPIFLETVESVIVTSPDHILQSIEESNLLDYLSKYTKVVLDPSLEDTVKSAQTISAASLETVIKLVENGTGYTWLPKNLIKNQLNNYSLKQLKIANKNIYYDFYMYVNKNSLVQDVLGEFINHLELTEIK
ncbi:LysR family transcriptional regulator [Providencia stuartii]|uniref:Transcriptional regulator, LysR family n=1 Tax=Providencia stuartii ATCC 25827 TaxID=471874 RepID=A0AA86YJA0_PROST|nr:LysR family transcriptional regulator [Providencia stuartii]EDU59263.1 transcriptional regulator, LysR family [Providencia stuartii ATCC 25827]MTC81117.1 LysR family transcriptional regulator [Providencia stuartii]MTC93344.1 LysR family transcriptional regulator [Providencia stuartii]